MVYCFCNTIPPSANTRAGTTSEEPLPNPHTKPDAQNKQVRAGRVVSSQFRHTPATIRMFDELVAHYEETTGEPWNRSKLSRYLIEREHERVFGATELPPPAATKRGRPRKGKV